MVGEKANSTVRFQSFGPDLSPDCLLMFSEVLPPVVIYDKIFR